jgi:ubiquinone/menaquinone biosynthesis C-methylase UbiE
MNDDALYRDLELAEFYDIDNARPRDDFRFVRRLAKDAQSILDIGCGTGELAVELADGRDVVGIDPARAMLDIARRRRGGNMVEWIEADVRNMQLARTFDLIVMTGHAFQTLLTASDRRAALNTIAAHLESGGRFIFDSRTPAVAEWREWTPTLSARTLEHPRRGRVRAWNDVSHDSVTGVVTYETHYEAVTTSHHIWSASQIAFPEKEDLAMAISEAGLTVERSLGDWTETPWSHDAPEIIALGRLAA